MGKEKVFCRQLKGRRRFLRLLGDKSKKHGFRSGLVTLKPFEAVGEHETVNKEEVIIVLKGEASIYYGKNKKIETKQGSFVYIPPDTLHNVKNSGNKILQYVYVTVECV
jgi:mannose-6-phosphate isomerase-like protein (cupin superfamily)